MELPESVYVSCQEICPTYSNRLGPVDKIGERAGESSNGNDRLSLFLWVKSKSEIIVSKTGHITKWTLVYNEKWLLMAKRRGRSSGRRIGQKVGGERAA